MLSSSGVWRLAEPSDDDEEPGVRRGRGGGMGGLEGEMATGCFGALEKREMERCLGRRAEDGPDGSAETFEPASDLPRLMLRTDAKGRMALRDEG